MSVKAKLKSFLQLFNLARTNRLRKYKKECVDNPRKDMRVVVIDPERDELHLNLGISTKRWRELTDLCKKAFNDHEYMTDSMEEVSLQVVHPNELAYCMYALAFNNVKNKFLKGGAGIPGAIHMGTFGPGDQLPDELRDLLRGMLDKDKDPDDDED